MAERFQTEEAAQKIKVNIMIATGKETQTKIHRVLCGAIILLVTKAVAHALDGITAHQTQQEGKTLIGAIVILPEAHMMVAREVAQGVVSQEVHHLVAAEEDHVQGVGINSTTFTYENFTRALARWDTFVFCPTNISAKFYRNGTII